MIMINSVLIDNIGGGAVTAKKDRVRLTVYVDAATYARFVRDAEAKYRNLSDHMNAILAEHYGKQNEAKNLAALAEEGGS